MRFGACLSRRKILRPIPSKNRPNHGRGIRCPKGARAPIKKHPVWMIGRPDRAYRGARQAAQRAAPLLSRPVFLLRGAGGCQVHVQRRRLLPCRAHCAAVAGRFIGILVSHRERLCGGRMPPLAALARPPARAAASAGGSDLARGAVPALRCRPAPLSAGGTARSQIAGLQGRCAPVAAAGGGENGRLAAADPAAMPHNSGRDQPL